MPGAGVADCADGRQHTKANEKPLNQNPSPYNARWVATYKILKIMAVRGLTSFHFREPIPTVFRSRPRSSPTGNYLLASRRGIIQSKDVSFAGKTESTGVSNGGPALAGFLVSGFLLALLGAILPAWGYHRDPADFVAVGNYFLSLAAGIVVGARGSPYRS